MESRIARCRTVCHLSLGLGTLALLFSVTPADAGPRSERSGGALSRTTRAVGAKTNSTPSPRASSGSNSSSSQSSSSSAYQVEPAYHPTYGTGGCYGCVRVGSPPAYSGQQPRVTVDLGLQTVKDSDGAAMAETHIRGDRFGAMVSGTHYFEETPASDGSDTVYMNLWTIAIEGRLVQSGGTSLWVMGGFGGTASNEFEPLTGAVFGAQVQHVVNRNLDFYGSARYFVLQESMRASEVRAGVGASFLTVGYRRFAFRDAGEPLQGPEFGMSVGF